MNMNVEKGLIDEQSLSAAASGVQQELKDEKEKPTNIFQKFEVKHLRAKTGKSINLEFANQFSIKLNTLKIMEVINSI